MHSPPLKWNFDSSSNQLFEKINIPAFLEKILNQPPKFQTLCPPPPPASWACRNRAFCVWYSPSVAGAHGIVAILFWNLYAGLCVLRDPLLDVVLQARERDTCEKEWSIPPRKSRFPFHSFSLPFAPQPLRFLGTGTCFDIVDLLVGGATWNIISYMCLSCLPNQPIDKARACFST